MSKKIERVRDHHIGSKVNFQITPEWSEQAGVLIGVGKGARAGWLSIVEDESKDTMEVHVDHLKKLGGKFF